MNPDAVQVAWLALGLGLVALVTFVPRTLRRRSERRRRGASPGTERMWRDWIAEQLRKQG